MLDDIQKAEAERQLAHREVDRLAEEKRIRANAEKVCQDALDARNRAEKDRDTARAALRRYQRLYEVVRDENAKLRAALEEQLFAPNPSDERALALLDRKS
jgi:hypothetical protein